VTTEFELPPMVFTKGINKYDHRDNISYPPTVWSGTWEDYVDWPASVGTNGEASF